MAAGRSNGDPVTHRESCTDSFIYFFYDSEGSGGSAIRDQVIEVAAVVMTTDGQEPGDRERRDEIHFHSLCHCSCEIQEGAWLKHGIAREALVGQRPVGEVLGEMLGWMVERVREVQRLRQRPHKAVLVAHGGVAFDFPLLVTEVKRSNLEARLRDLEPWFADTHHLCQQLRETSDPALRGTSKLSLSELNSLFFPPGQDRPACLPRAPHRALGDALTLRRLFSETPLSGHLGQLELVSTEDLLRRWQLSVDAHLLTERLGLHKQKAKGLVQRGQSLGRLEEQFRESGYSEQWLRDHLRGLGVKRPGSACLQYFRELL